jgi:hypothetical protein
MLSMIKKKKVYTYSVQPKIIDSFTSSVLGQLYAEFTTVFVGRVFPFRSDAFLEQMVV